MISAQLNGVGCINPFHETQLRSRLAQAGERINGFCLRGGRHPSTATLLLTRSQITQELKDSTSIEIKLVDGATEVTCGEMSLWRTKNLGPITGDNDLILAYFVDRRHFAQTHKRRSDVDHFPPHTQFPTLGKVFQSTNQAALDAYWLSSNMLGSLLSHSNVEYPTILLRDVQTKNEQSSWDIFNDVLDLISHKVYKNYSSGFTVTKNAYINNTNTNLVDNNSDRRIAIQDDQTEYLSSLPEKVRTRYRQFSWDHYNESLSYLDTYGGAGTTVSTIRDVDCYNIYNPYDIDQSSYEADLDTLADEISSLYFGSYDNHLRNDAIYNGIIPFEPGPDAEVIEFYHDLETNYYRTRVKSIDANAHTFPKIDRELEGYYKRNIILDVKPDTDVVAGSSGVCSVYVNGIDTSENITAHLLWADDEEDVAAGTECSVRWDWLKSQWVFYTGIGADEVGGSDSGSGSDGNFIIGLDGCNIPVGASLAYSGDTAPEHFLMEDGSEHLIADYPELYDVIGDKYGPAPSGNEYFLVANMQGRTFLGADGVVYQVGDTGGNATTESLSVAGMTDTEPDHDHSSPLTTDPPSETTSTLADILGIPAGGVLSSLSEVFHNLSSEDHTHDVTISPDGEHSHIITGNATPGTSVGNLPPYVVRNSIILAESCGSGACEDEVSWISESGSYREGNTLVNTYNRITFSGGCITVESVDPIEIDLCCDSESGSGSGSVTVTPTIPPEDFEEEFANGSDACRLSFGLFNTGEESTNNGNGCDEDDHYTSAGDFPGEFIGFNNGNWIEDDANSKWISPDCNGSNYGVGDTVYSLELEIPAGTDLSTVAIVGRCLGDDRIEAIEVNGVDTGYNCITDPTGPDSLKCFTEWTYFAATNWVVGTNTVDITVHNESSSPGQGFVTGFRCEWSAQCDYPNGGGEGACNIAEDTFTGTDATALPSHTPDSGLPGFWSAWTNAAPYPGFFDFELLNNKAADQYQGSGPFGSANLFNAGISNGIIEVTGTTGGGDFYNTLAIICRHANNDFIFCWVNKQNSTMYISRYESGFTNLATSSFTLATNTSYSLKVTLEGDSITFSVDSTEITATSSLNQGSKIHGLFSHNQGNNTPYNAATFDDLCVSSLGPDGS